MDNDHEPSVAEAVANLLRQHRAKPTTDSTNLLAKAAADIRGRGLDDVEMVICAVALAEVLAQEGRVSWLQHQWVHETQLRAQDWLLLVAKGSADRSSVGLEEWLLSIGAPLAAIPVPSRPEPASTIAQLTARLASLSGDTAVATELFRSVEIPLWTANARVDVATTIIELAVDSPDAIQTLDLDGARRSANAYLDSIDDLSPEAAARLQRVLASNNEIEHRLTSTYGALLSSGDYKGAVLIARQIREAPEPRLALIGANLEVIAQLHTAEFDDSETAAAEISRLRVLASLPESLTLETAAPLASPQAMLRELVAHQLGVGGSGNRRNAAAALHALVESRSAMLGTRISSAPIVDQLAEMASRTRNMTPADLFGFVPDTGERIIHVGELTITPDSAVTATTTTTREHTVGVLTSFFGNDLRVLSKLLQSPERAEQLTEREIGRLRRLFHIPIDHDGIIQPTGRLWTIPWERLAPQARIGGTAPNPTIAGSSLPAAGPPRFVAVIDDQLPGARLERSTLLELRDSGLIDLVLTESLAAFASELTTTTRDVAVLAVHGEGEGLTYRFRLGEETLPAHRIAELRLPPIVSAASCRSGTVGTGIDLASILRHNTLAAVVSLWDIIDHDTSIILDGFYRRIATGNSAPEAWRPDAASAAAIGLRLIRR